MAHRQRDIRLAVKSARDKGNRPPRHDLANEHHPAPPAPVGFATDIEPQVHFLKVPVQRKGNAKYTGAEETKADDTQEGRADMAIPSDAELRGRSSVAATTRPKRHRAGFPCRHDLPECRRLSFPPHPCIWRSLSAAQGL